MITDEKKKRIESLSTDVMLYEINLGRKSRYQRENFAYLQTCYQLRLAEEEKKLTSEQTMAILKSKENTDKVNHPILNCWPIKTIGKIFIIVCGAVLSAIAIYYIGHYIGLQLK